MEKYESRKLLFQIACSAVACDGFIDQKEVAELHYIDESTSYFKDIDFSSDVESFVDRFNQIGNKIVDETLELLSTTNLSPVFQLLMLEIVLRLVYADQKIEESEIEFIRKVRSSIPLSDKIIIERFGNLDILFSSNYDKIKNSNLAIKAITAQEKNKPDINQMYHGIDK